MHIPGRYGRLVIFSTAGLFVLFLGIIAYRSDPLVLQVVSVKEGKPILMLPMQPDERFTLHYYHSVENTPIWEVHSIDRHGRIYIEEERYLKFGAGMGRMPGTGRLVMRGPYEVIEDMHMPTGNFILRVGSPGVDHTILWRKKKINLSASIPHKAVRFSARPMNPFMRVWRRMVPHSATPK
jgi:hypothetical protein